MPRVACPDCERDIPVHRLETRTTAQREGFDTRYRCPFCRADFANVADRLVS